MTKDNKKRKYSQLKFEEREEIALFLELGKSQKYIADQLGKNQSTISREISRNKPSKNNTKYRAIQSQKRAEYRKRVGHQRERLKNRELIDKRCEEANERKRIGDFEIETIVFRQSKVALCVIADRQTRYTLIKKIPTKHKDVMKSAIKSSLSKIKKEFIKTLTFDNGTENTSHYEIAEEMGIKIETYFCNPYHSWEKGTIENRNGKIRFFLPKKTDFDKIPEEKILRIQNIINNRPLKCLNYKTPYECIKYALRN